MGASLEARTVIRFFDLPTRFNQSCPAICSPQLLQDGCLPVIAAADEAISWLEEIYKQYPGKRVLKHVPYAFYLSTRFNH
jgi:hypothetical protein